MTIGRWLPLLLVALLAGCSGESDASDSASTGETSATAPAELFLNAEYVDAITGERFRITEQTAAGNYVLVELMAVWCPLCLSQQLEVAKYEAEAPDDLVSLSLDIDPNEERDLLRLHAETHGFPWHFAIAPLEASRGIAAAFGSSYLNPPSTPMLLVRPDNSVVPLRFGIKSGSELMLFVEQNRLQ